MIALEWYSEAVTQDTECRTTAHSAYSQCHPTKIEALKESAASLLQQFGLPPFELFHSTCEQCFILLNKERAILNNLVIEYICTPARGSGQTSLAPALQLGEAEEKSWLASG